MVYRPQHLSLHTAAGSEPVKRRWAPLNEPAYCEKVEFTFTFYIYNWAYIIIIIITSIFITRTFSSKYKYK